MIGFFGSAPFTVSDQGVLTFRDLTREITVRYATHELLGVKPKTEFIGEGLDAVSFCMTLDASLGVNVRAVLALWEGTAARGEAHFLVVGERLVGRNRYVITDLSQAYGVITGSGGLVSASLDVSLQEYA